MDKYSALRKRPYIPLLILVAVAAFGFIIMLLWNALMPVIFRLPEITFWQALGLFLLSRLLLGGFGPGGGGGRRERRNRRKEEVLHHLRERWEHMTPEQRDNLRRSWKRRWDLNLDDEMVGGGDVMTPPPVVPPVPPVPPQAPPPPPGEGRA